LLVEDQNRSRLLERFRKNPFVPIGIAGFLGTVGFFIYRVRNRKSTTSLQMYLIQLRVGAQALAVFGVFSAAIYDAYYIHPKKH